MTSQPYQAPPYPPMPGRPPHPADGSAVTPAQVLGLASLVLTQALLVLAVITTNIALPLIQRDLALSVSTVGWLLMAYTLPLGALPLVAARIGEVVGRKLVHLVGISLFALASMAAGLAQSTDVLIGARVGQGVGAALSTAGALALLEQLSVSAQVRRIALGCYFTVPVAAFACSLLAGGLMVEYLGTWRACFTLFAVAGLVLSVIAMVTLPETGRTRGGLNLLSALAGSTGLILLTQGLTRVLDPGTPLAQALLWLVGAALLLALAATGSQFVRHPSRVLLNRYGAYLVVVLLAGALFGSYFTLTIVLQAVFGYSPLETGRAMLPSAAATVAAALLLPPLARLVGVRWVAAGAAACAALGFWWLTGLTPAPDAAGMLPPMLLLSFGAGGAITIPTAYARGEMGERGALPGGLNSARNLGMSLGIVLISGLSATSAQDFLRGHAPKRGVSAFADAWLQAAVSSGFPTAAALSALAAVVALCTLPGRGYR